MAEPKAFLILRKVLGALGLPGEAVDELIEWIQALLAGKDKAGGALDAFPYRLRDDFLSPAERSFYLVARSAVVSWATVCPKVNLGDLFFAACKDPGERRAYTNKIDRKHVDFLLCDPQTGAPILGVELNDRSHERPDRKDRDGFVKGVFAAAGLPLASIPVRTAYSPGALDAELRHLAGRPRPAPVAEAAETLPPAALVVAENPVPVPPSAENRTCPRCGSAMALRVAKSGANAGGKFWGCTAFPKCRTILPCAEAS